MGPDKSSLNTHKLLEMIMKIEGESTNLLKRLVGMANNSGLKLKLRFLLNDEEAHQSMLKGLVHKLGNQKEKQIPDGVRIPNLMMAYMEQPSINDLMECAMNAEKMAMEFYDYLASETDDHCLREVCKCLSLMEQGHHALLEGEYKLCLWYDRYPECDLSQLLME